MSDVRFWQEKICQLFHDPPVKVFRLFRNGGHMRPAQEWLDLLAGAKKVWLGFPLLAREHGYQETLQKIPDLVSTGADRPVLGSSQTRVDWWKDPVTRHPLDGTSLKWQPWNEETVDSDITALLKDQVVGNWSDANQLRLKFLWLWRSLPSLLMEKHGPLWSVIPADSRIPDHTIWDHLRMTSAYAGARNHPHFFVFAIGPVQTFIHQARTARDLWIGSYLLADLAWAAIEPVAEEFGPDSILYPSLFSNPLADQWLATKFPSALSSDLGISPYTRSSMLPNKFVALLPKEKILNDLPNKCKSSVDARWKTLTLKVREHLCALKNNGKWEAIWDRQLMNSLECRWIAVPWNTVSRRLRNYLKSVSWQSRRYQRSEQASWMRPR